MGLFQFNDLFVVVVVCFVSGVTEECSTMCGSLTPVSPFHDTLFMFLSFSFSFYLLGLLVWDFLVYNV